MNFLRNKKLKHLGGYLFALAVFIFFAEYFILDSQIQELEEARLKKEFTRTMQLSNQQISMMVQEYVSGNPGIAPLIASEIEQQEQRLQVLSAGGRIEESTNFLSPLKRLPRVTYVSLRDEWDVYKKSIFQVLTDNAEPAARTVSNGDSTGLAIAVPVARTNTSSFTTLQYQGLSLSMKKWYDRLMLDLDEEMQYEASLLSKWRASITIVNIILTGLFLFAFIRFIIQPLELLKGNILGHVHTKNFPQNEIGEVALTVNKTLENLRDATEFVSAIGNGNLSISYKESLDNLYVPGTNRLADSLIDMQNKLRELNEEEQKRQWANEGVAKFVDILRSSHDNLNTLGDKIVSGLVQYTKCNQGTLYILNDEDERNRYLELVSLFAFDIKKHEEQKIKPGQGILGQSFLEKETTYLTNLPEEYIRITSGLGGAKPKSILIVPLKVDKDVYGLVELASFEEMDAHVIAFVEKLGETIASTLESVRGVQKQKHLIEQFQTQTEQMRAQEEEMRQNMEELQATQEEVSRKEKSYLSKIQELEHLLEKEKTERSEADSLQREFAQKELNYKQKLEQLQKLLDQKNTKSEDWETIQELERTLRFNLEAMKIANEELNRKRSR